VKRIRPDAREAIRSADLRGARLRDFEDFVSGDAGRGTGRWPHADPTFRERLRRTLWRIQVTTRRPWALIRH